MSVGNIRKLQEKFRCIVYWEKNAPGKRYQRIRTCLTGEVEMSSSPIRMWDIRIRGSGEGGMLADRIPPWVEWAMWQGGPSTCARCRDPSAWWHGARKAIRINSIRIPQEDMWRAPLSGLPQGEAHGTREHHGRTITYPIRICCLDHWLKWASLAMSFRQLATAHVLPPSDGVSGHLLLLAFRICLWKRTSKLRFLMFLSFPLLWHGFQRTLLNHRLLWWSKSYQNTKT